MIKPVQQRYFATLLLLLVCGTLAAQTLPDSLKVVVQRMVEEEVDNKLNWIYFIGFPTAAVFTLYGFFLWFIGIRKKAEKVLEEQVEKQIQEKLSQVTGVKINTIAEYFKQYENDLKAKESAEIYMVVSSGIDIPPIVDFLKRSRYKNFNSLRLDSPSPLDIPTGAIVILNTQLPEEKKTKEKDHVSDKEFDDYVSSFVDKVKLIYFGNERYNGKFTHRMKNFANTEATLPDALLKVVRI